MHGYSRPIVFIIALCGSLTLSAAPEPVIKGDVIHFKKGEVRGVAITQGHNNHLLAALSFAGAVSLSGEGELLDSYEPDDPLSELIAVAVSPEYAHPGGNLYIVALVNLSRFRIELRGLDPDSGRFMPAARINENGFVPVPPRTTHACFARDRHDGSLYLFAGGDHGRLVQFRVFTDVSGAIVAREMQQLLIGGATTACNSDAGRDRLLVAEPGMGLWQMISDPEEVPLREPVALNEPYGQLGEPVAVEGVYSGGQRFALIADNDQEAFLRLSAKGEIVSRQSYDDAMAGDLKGTITAIATGRLFRDGHPQDLMAVAAIGDAGDGDIHLVSLVNDETSEGPVDLMPGAVVQTRTVSAPISGGIDAADDPAIWIHPDNKADSLILGADKGAGVGVYDLSGKLLQFLPDGRINNIDLRPGFDGHPDLAHIAVGSDRTHMALAIYAIDEKTRRLRRVDARTIPAEFHDLYGLCMYRSRQGELYAFATSADGQMHQWRLFPVPGGKVDAERVRHINIGTVAEGCVVDDETGYLYVSEERVAVWRYGAEPDAGDDRTAVARIEESGVLAEDLEGLAIYPGAEGGGYLVVTSEGSDNYAVYNRQAPHEYRGSFRIRANTQQGLDGTSQTDGIEVTSVALPGYPAGLMVAQDGRYDETQNFKFVSWEDIAAQLKLE